MGFPKKLTDEQRLIVCRLHAEGSTPTEIQRYIADEWKITFTLPGISNITGSKRYQVHIKTFKEAYLKRIKDVPLANKRIRLDDLQYARDKIIKCMKSNPCENKAQRDEFMRLNRSLNEVIASSREEMEKKPNLIPGLGLVGDFSDKSDEELSNERDEILKNAERTLNRRAPGADGNPERAIGENQEESA